MLSAQRELKMCNYGSDNLSSRGIATPVYPLIREPSPFADPFNFGTAPAHDESSGMESALGLWERLVSAFEAFALQFDQPGLGEIELPPTGTSESDQANLRALAPLCMAAEMEETRLLSAVESLAGVFASGGLSVDLGQAAPLLVEFWRKRRDRFNSAERQALFARLFGGSRGPSLAAADGSNNDFENLMIDLTDALANRYDAGITAGGDVRLRLTARQLASNLLERNTGFATMATRDLLGDVKTALAILKEPMVQRAVSSRSVWTAVSEIARRYLQEEIEVGVHLTRGKAGMLVLAWLAEVLPQLDDYGGVVLLQLGDQVVGAAIEWLQASLSLAEQQPAQAAQFTA